MSIVYILYVSLIFAKHFKVRVFTVRVFTVRVFPIAKFGGHTEPQKIEFFKQPWKDDFGFEVAR